MKIDRLLMIINLLMANDSLTAKYLAQYFNTSTKTIYRDIDTLSVAGIPIITIKGKNGGIKILDNYKLKSSLVSEDEKKSILLGLELLNSLKGVNSEDTVTKLKAQFHTNVNNFIEVDLSPWACHSDKNIVFKNILNSLFNSVSINFIYIDSNGKETNRTVNPLKLIFKNSNWYLVAFCLKSNDYRFFKVLKITNLTLLDTTFDFKKFHPPTMDNQILTKNAYDVLLHFNLSCLNRVYEDFGKESVTIENKKLIVNTKLTLDRWAYSYLTTYGNQVTIIYPQVLKDNLKKYLIESLENL